jgi:hypothetical protein
MNIKLIDEWKHAWKMVSMWCMALPATFLSAWVLVPPEFQATIPHDWLMKITIAMLVIGMAGRVVKQGSIPNESK